MQDSTAAIDRLVDETFASLTAALATAALPGAPLERTRAVDRALESLSGFAIGVFAAGVAARLSLGADLAGAELIRAALYQATSSAEMLVQPRRVDVDAIIDDQDRLITPAVLRARVAGRLGQGRADARRIVRALVAIAAPHPRVIDDLVHADLVATRFGEQIEKVWSRLRGGTTYVQPPKRTRSAPITDNYCWMVIR